MEKTEKKEMRITRTFKTPIDLMWEVWTNPEQLHTGGDLMCLPTQFTKWTSRKGENGN